MAVGLNSERGLGARKRRRSRLSVRKRAEAERVIMLIATSKNELGGGSDGRLIRGRGWTRERSLGSVVLMHMERAAEKAQPGGNRET